MELISCGSSGAVKRAGLKMDFYNGLYYKQSRGLVPSGVRILPPAHLLKRSAIPRFQKLYQKISKKNEMVSGFA